MRGKKVKRDTNNNLECMLLPLLLLFVAVVDVVAPLISAPPLLLLQLLDPPPPPPPANVVEPESPLLLADDDDVIAAPEVEMDEFDGAIVGVKGSDFWAVLADEDCSEDGLAVVTTAAGGGDVVEETALRVVVVPDDGDAVCDMETTDDGRVLGLLTAPTAPLVVTGVFTPVT